MVAARNGNVVIARLRDEGSVLFKMFHQTGPKGETIRLTSYNPIYPPLEFHLGAFRFIYPVYEMHRKTF
jgi:SOS-response transcriptional repressor LexA